MAFFRTPDWVILAVLLWVYGLQ